MGGTGGVGQLVVANLLQQGSQVRLLTRNPGKTEQMFAKVASTPGQLEIVAGDIREPASLPAAMPDITHVICTVGSTAFPSYRWDFDLPANLGIATPGEWVKLYLDSEYRKRLARNSPAQVDGVGVTNLVAATPKDLQRFVLVSSCGVERQNLFPYTVLNAYGVLTAKKLGETALRQSGLPFTILRPGRLIDGPFTSLDLNTLLQARTNQKLGVVVWTGDRLTGDTSRMDVAAACVACLDLPNTLGKAYELINQGPRPADLDWAELFAQAERRG
jgi:uncharacterized protein YbjT (DUF2867 family)